MLYATYATKIRPLLCISLNTFITKPSFENLRGVFLPKCRKITKVDLHVSNDL